MARDTKQYCKARLMSLSCTQRVPNSETKEIRDKYPLPKVPATRPAQLNPMMRSETSNATKAEDKQLGRMQTLLLDSLLLAPPTSLMEAHHKDADLDYDGVFQAVRSSMQLQAMPMLTYYTSGERGS